MAACGARAAGDAGDWESREPKGGLIVMPDGFLHVHRAQIVSLAARYRLPTIYPWRFFAELGGLLSY